MRYRVISMWQPWASLWLVRDLQGERVKRHETRGRKYPDSVHGQRIAVHAARTTKGFSEPHMTNALADICDEVFGPHWGLELPRGAIIGTVQLAGFFHTEEAAKHISADDYVCGDWSDGRFAWLGNEPLLLRQPVLFKGRQGWFDWDAPDDLTAAA